MYVSIHISMIRRALFGCTQYWCTVGQGHDVTKKYLLIPRKVVFVLYTLTFVVVTIINLG